MDLVRPTDIPHQWIERSIGTSRIQCVLGFVFAVGVGCVVYRLGAPEFLDLHWGLKVLVTPFLLLGALVWLVVTHAMWQGMLGAFRSGNWILKVGGDHVFLNLRCYSNYDLGGDTPTVARIHGREIESAGRLRESFELSNSDASRVTTHLEIRLRHRDTDELREAVRMEAAVEPPMRNYVLFTMKSRSTMRPVVVTEPGVIRVAWRGSKMLRALSRLVPIVAPRDHDLADPSDRGTGSQADDRILELIERGEHMAALELVREAYSMSATDANRFLAELEGARDETGREPVDAVESPS